jgi:small subunit ribosomal protein S9
MTESNVLETAPQNSTAAAGTPSTTHSESSHPELTLGSGAPAQETGEPKTAPTLRGRIDKFGTAMGTGRRKTSVARVRIRPGNGKISINSRTLEDYFRFERNRALIEGPFNATDTLGKYDVWVRVQGGGTTGQAGAIVLGIARALQALDPGLHHRLADGGFLTRDGRMVERKKYGKKKARRSFQFSKR